MEVWYVLSFLAITRGPGASGAIRIYARLIAPETPDLRRFREPRRMLPKRGKDLDESRPFPAVVGCRRYFFLFRFCAISR